MAKLLEIYERIAAEKAAAAQKIADLEQIAEEYKQTEIQKIVALITNTGAEIMVDPIHLLYDIRKAMGEPDESLCPPTPEPTPAPRKGKPSIKGPLQQKLTAAGVSYGSNYSVKDLQDLVEKHGL